MAVGGIWCRPAAAVAAAAARARSRAARFAHTRTFTRCHAPTTHTHARCLASVYTFGSTSAIFPFFTDIFEFPCDAFDCKAPDASVTLLHHFINILIISISLQMFPNIPRSCLLSSVSHRVFNYWRCYEDLSFCQVLNKAGVSVSNRRDFVTWTPLLKVLY